MRQKMTFKREKLSEKIKADLNSFLRTGVRDPRLQFVSITRVELNGDYSVAKVYWDSFQSENQSEIDEAMKRVGGRLRTQLANALHIRNVPELKFYYDSQFEDELKITQILKDLK